MLTLRNSLVLGLVIASACGGSNPPPEGGVTPQGGPGGQGGRRLTPGDSLRIRAAGNTVMENARPDAPGRAGLLVVANQQGANATIINAATMQTIATVPVGLGPHESAVSPDGRWAVVTNYGDRTVQGNTLSVIDLSAPTLVVTRTIDLGEYHRPHGAAFVQDGKKLLVTSETSQRLLIVDFASGKVDTALATNGKGSHMVAVRRDGKKAWTANINDGNITEFDIEARRTVRTLTAAPDDEGIATTPGGILVWVGSNTAKTVTIIDTQQGKTVGTLSGFGGAPYRIGISRTGRVAVVCDPTGNKVWMYEIGTNRQLGVIDLGKVEGIKSPTGGQPGQEGAGPEGVTFDPISDFAYITLHGGNQVVAVDLNTYKVVGFGPSGTGPDGIAFSPLVRK